MLIKSLRALLLVILITGSVTATETIFNCGNVDGSPDGKVNLADVIYLIGHVYLGGNPPPVPELANVDGSDNNQLNLSDITRLICQIYLHSCDPLCPAVMEPRVSYCQGDTTPLVAGTLRLEVIDRDLHIYHDHAYYQCCLEYQVEFLRDGFEIIATESDIGLECDCICPFDLESVIHFLPSGEYELTLIGIAGDTVGTATATIPGRLELVLFGNSDCLTYETTSLLSSGVIYSYDNDTLFMKHTDAFFNCGFQLAMQLTRFGDTIRIYEGNILPITERMRCMCYFEISAAITGLDSGWYVLEVYANNWPMSGEPYDMVDRQSFSVP